MQQVVGGTSVCFISKVPSYSRVFLYETQGLDTQPQVVDIGKTVSQWIPNSITNITTSPQNSLVMLSGSRMNEVYIYRYYNNGEKDLFQAWTKWKLPGLVVALQIVNDQIGGNKWILGEKFSAADIYLFMLTTWLDPSRGHPSISNFPNVQRIADAVMLRPSVQTVYGNVN